MRPRRPRRRLTCPCSPGASRRRRRAGGRDAATVAGRRRALRGACARRVPRGVPHHRQRAGCRGRAADRLRAPDALGGRRRPGQRGRLPPPRRRQRRARPVAPAPPPRRRPAGRATDDDAAPASARETADPTTDPDDRALRDALRTAVAELPARAGQIFALRYFEEYTNRQIADRLDTTENSIGVTLHRARARMRATMTPWLTD
ncbi:MAG: sigma-70 family RNA polymerase sigma factor [Anaerolineae bacterium]